MSGTFGFNADELKSLQEAIKKSMEGIDIPKIGKLKPTKPERIDQKSTQSPGEDIAVLLTRIGAAEKDIIGHKNDIIRIDATMSAKLEAQNNIILVVLLAIGISVIGLVWQSFWMYPGIYKDYATTTETQNNKISDFQKQIEVLNNELTEAKSRIEQETDRRILLQKAPVK